MMLLESTLDELVSNIFFNYPFAIETPVKVITRYLDDQTPPVSTEWARGVFIFKNKEEARSYMEEIRSTIDSLQREEMLV